MNARRTPLSQGEHRIANGGNQSKKQWKDEFHAATMTGL
jgi:hypothetical protein